MRQLAKDKDGLTAKQRRFAEALIATRGNRTEAAKQAGYGEKSAHVSGSRVAKLPQVRAFLRQHTEEILADMAPEAAETLRALLRNKSGYVRLEAAKDVLNRNSIGTQKEKPDARPVIVNIDLGDKPALPPVTIEG